MWNHISVSFLTVRHADPDVRRRGRLFLIACLVVIGFLMLFVPLLVLVGQMTAALAIVGVLPLMVGALVLARSGRVVTGVRPEVAQTIVSLGVDLEGLRAVSTLEAALARR
jgi:hypothetical protein